jgi:hypothetical protein
MSQGHSGEVSEEAKAILQEEVSLSVTPMLVGVFVLCMCGMLLLLYFFFSYLGKLLHELLFNNINRLKNVFYISAQCSLRHHWSLRFGVYHSCLSVP